MNIHEGDCIDFVNTLKNNSIDCIVTDPPYFLDSMDNNWSSKQQKRRKSNSHIKCLPSGMKFDSSQGKKLNHFLSKLSKELYRVLKPGGFFLCFSSPRMYHNVVSAIEEAGFEIRDQAVWRYKTSQVKAFSQNHIIDKDKQMTEAKKTSLKKKLEGFRTPQLKCEFEPIAIAMKPVEGRFIDNMRVWGTGLMYVGDKVPANIFEFKKPKKEDYNIHPTVKPVDLCKKLIELYCPKGGIVLDPFLGSGTTAVACVQTRRKCVGSEKQSEYVEIIRQRLSSSTTL